VRWDNGCPQCSGTGIERWPGYIERCCICKGRPSRRQVLRHLQQGIDELVQEGTLDPHVDPDTGAVTYTVTATGERVLDQGRDPHACSLTASDEED